MSFRFGPEHLFKKIEILPFVVIFDFSYLNLINS